MKRSERKEWMLTERAIAGPQGVFRVSTIRTYAGGAPELGSGPFTTKDYAKDTPWPYETMVFGVGNSKGQYHEPHPDQEAAAAAHQAVIVSIKAGTLELGKGVSGVWGNPSTTPKQWRALALAMAIED